MRNISIQSIDALAQSIRPLLLGALCGALVGAAGCDGAVSGLDPSDLGDGSSQGTTGWSADAGGSSATGISTTGSSTAGSNGTDPGSTGNSGDASGETDTDGGTSAPDGGETDAGSGNTQTELVNPAPGGDFFMGANFWNIDWEGSGNYFQAGVDFATVDNPWRPELLTDLEPYHVLRFMDWNEANVGNNPHATWEARKQKADTQSQPVAFEWQIDLCNRTQTDYWVNIPHEANRDYWIALATLIRDELDPSLRVYVEWSNEVWNGIFPQHDYAVSQGQGLGITNEDEAAAYYLVHQSVRLFEAFEEVFGQDNPRLVKVLAGFAAWTGPCEWHIEALSDSAMNPNGTEPDVYAIAPYFNGTSVEELASSVSTAVDRTRASKECIDAIGLPLISYEGGADAYGAGVEGCTAIQHEAGMYQVYTNYLDGISEFMRGPFVHYTHSGACWGLKERTDDSLQASPKYRAVVDWLEANP